MGQSNPLWPWMGPWQRWDALWYQHLATSGYQPGFRDAAFFPLYPALTHVVGVILGDQFLLGGLLVSTAGYVAGLFLLHRLIEGDFDSLSADRTILYVALAPTAFFFLAPYTEALFLALSVGTFLAARRRRFVLAGILASLAALCRDQGIILVLPILVEIAADWRHRCGGGRRTLPRAYGAAVLPVLSLCAYFVSTQVLVGDRGGFLTAHALYGGQHLVGPWSSVPDSLWAAFSGSHWEELLNLASLLLAAIAIPFMLGRFPWSYSAYAASMTLPLFFHEAFYSPLMSSSRFVLVVFPLFTLLALAGRRDWVDRIVLTTSPFLMGACLFVYTHIGFVA